ncbi:hypothetical protein DPMN_183828 [Dreissena polymorpha]|uniref:B box-type domain-containing protein n=1 Tax=Dreissena polymorpha TaxID=45954 RepID=A0A9D4DJQ8_DREPO|nr:hypothetical protein DPMN_183828 [Dreissena polymorpha]
MATFSQSTIQKGSDMVQDFLCSSCEDTKLDKTADFYCESCVKFYCRICIVMHSQLFTKHAPLWKGRYEEMASGQEGGGFSFEM